jgi:hypothetical protein
MRILPCGGTGALIRYLYITVNTAFEVDFSVNRKPSLNFDSDVTSMDFICHCYSNRGAAFDDQSLFLTNVTNEVLGR